MKDEILIRYISKRCTATEEKEILEWLKEKENRQRLFELEQIWGLKAEMRFSDKGRMDEAYRQLGGRLGLGKQAEERDIGTEIHRQGMVEICGYFGCCLSFCNKLVLYHERGASGI